MTRTGLLALALLGACDLGIGSDPDPQHLVRACAPGHSRLAPHTACVAASVPAIAIDGSAADWSAVPDFEIGGGRLSIAGNNDDEGDLLIRVTFPGGPLEALSLELAPSPARPASGGTDRITVDASGVRYEKNAMAVTPETPQLELAWTPDGLEAAVLSTWLTYQGATRLQLVGTRAGAEVIRTEAVDACFAFRAGEDALPETACEVGR
jgi:hypothetical protein